MAGHVLRDGHTVAVPNENYETARGDGGLCGSARDLARWFQAFASGAIAQGRSSPPFHPGRFDVGPFVVSVESREGSLWLESPALARAAGWFASGRQATRSMAIPGAWSFTSSATTIDVRRFASTWQVLEWPGRRVGP